MGLLQNILISVIHLAFVAMDILIIMIVLRQIYERWQPACLKLIVTTFEPALESIIDHVRDWVADVTGKTFSDRTLLAMIVASSIILRLVICNLM